MRGNLEKGLASLRRNSLLFLLVAGLSLLNCMKRQAVAPKPEKPEEFHLPPLPFTWSPKEISIRVGLGEFDELYLFLEDTFFIYEGDNLKFQGTQSPLKVTIIRSKPAQYNYYVSYGDFESMSEALDKAREVSDFGRKARVMEIGKTFRTKKGDISSTSYLVYQGPYPSQSEALSNSTTLRKTIFKEVKVKPSGTLKLSFGDKTFETNSILRIVSKSPMKVMNFQKKDHYSGGKSQKPFNTSGILEVRPSNNGKLLLVNELPLETYIEGVLKGEVPLSFPQEALKAQAVAARTNALSSLNKKLSIYSEPYDVTADIFTQNFEGFNDSPYLKSIVEATKGEILTYDGKIITIFYFSSCGGALASSQEIFGKNLPYYTSRTDNPGRSVYNSLFSESSVRNFIDNPAQASCGNSGNRYFRWERTTNAYQLSEIVRKKLGKDIGLVRNLKITKRGPSGRAQVLYIEGERGSVFVEGDFEIRRVLDANMLPSSLIYINSAGDSFIIRGAGFGHGVGMCQFGAAGMATKGKNYKEILNFYYPGTKIEKIY